LNVILKTNTTGNQKNYPVSIATPAGVPTGETGAIDSIIACGSKCDISQADVQLAKDWKGDWQKYRDLQTSNAGSAQNDLANSIPLLLVGLPLFWYHFARIRREGHDDTPSTLPTQPTI